MHLAYATSPLNPLVPPSGRVRSREGLQKIYPQNLKRKKNKQRKENKEIKRVTHTIYTMEETVHDSIGFFTLRTQVTVYTQALYAFQATLSL